MHNHSFRTSPEVSASQPRDQPPGERQTPAFGEEFGAVPPLITLRGLVLGVLSFAAIVHWLTIATKSQLPLVVYASFVLWLFLNLLLKRLSPRLALRRGELLTIFISGWVVGTIPGSGWMYDLIAIMATPTAYAGPENQWAELLFDLLPWHVFAKTSSHVIDGFWFSLEEGAPLPWYAGWERSASGSECR